MGGLGNQLFQYAAARAVAHYHPGARICVGKETENSHNHRGNNYALIFMKDAVVVDNVSCAQEFHQEMSFAPWRPEHIHPPVRLCGYFQYLPAIQPILPDLVAQFREALRPFVPRFEMDPETSVFVHVRRGDYLGKAHYHFVQTCAYYERAFAEWRRHFTGDRFQVYMVSDDPFWCRCQQWTFPYLLYDDDDEMRTLALMSQCKAGAIIANSTFSYWGAMLSQSAHVFYPERWVAETIHDLFPSQWCCVSG